MPAYQQDLKTIAVQMNINTVTPAVWIDHANNVKYTGLVASGDGGANVSPPNLPASNLTASKVHGMAPTQYGGFSYLNAWIG